MKIKKNVFFKMLIIFFFEANINPTKSIYGGTNGFEVKARAIGVNDYEKYRKDFYYLLGQINKIEEAKKKQKRDKVFDSFRYNNYAYLMLLKDNHSIREQQQVNGRRTQKKDNANATLAIKNSSLPSIPRQFLNQQITPTQEQFILQMPEPSTKTKILYIEYFGSESEWKKKDIIAKNKLEPKENQYQNKLFDFKFAKQKEKLQQKNLMPIIEEGLEEESIEISNDNKQNKDKSHNFDLNDNISICSSSSNSSDSTISSFSNNKKKPHNQNKKKQPFFSGANALSKNMYFINKHKKENIQVDHLIKVKKIGLECIGFNKNNQWINITEYKYNLFNEKINKK
jgi:hypothetical protein